MDHEYTLIRSGRKTLALEISSGASLIVRAPKNCPQQTIDRFIKSREVWISEHLERQRRREEAHPEPSPEGRQALIDRAREILPEKVAYYAKLMNLSPQAVTITNARKRFGSCSGKNRLCFSWRLIQYPDSAVDYVVVHELAHIRHKNHSREFHALIASVLPDHRQRRRLLGE